MANSLVYWTQDLVRAGLLVKGSRVFAMTSAGDRIVWKSYGAVSAAKSALESHIRQLAFELAPLGITANSIKAGVTDTPALRKIGQRGDRRRLTNPSAADHRRDVALRSPSPTAAWLPARSAVMAARRGGLGPRPLAH
jgi:NAD(P)-dependent dehydrogenase (short-subunit alcohol dehydrogenase family)